MKSKTVINSSVVETDAFLSLPLTAQGLYMHLNLYCDSMGAVDSITIPKRVCGASDNDVAALRAGGWIIEVDGVTFIRDWLVHNTVREKDRHSKHAKMMEAALIIEEGQPYRPKRGFTQGTPRADSGLTLLNKHASKHASNSEPAAYSGEGGGSAQNCPQCGDYLTSGRCFNCGFYAPDDTPVAGGEE